MDGFQKIKLIGFRLPRSQIRISTDFSGAGVFRHKYITACEIDMCLLIIVYRKVGQHVAHLCSPLLSQRWWFFPCRCGIFYCSAIIAMIGSDWFTFPLKSTIPSSTVIFWENKMKRRSKMSNGIKVPVHSWWQGHNILHQGQMSAVCLKH